MIKTFTYDDVVRYLYAETTEQENALIVEALALDDDLMNFYLDSLDLQNEMNRIVKVPSEKSIHKILSYANQNFMNNKTTLSL
jgi:hypothetical protein